MSDSVDHQAARDLAAAALQLGQRDARCDWRQMRRFADACLAIAELRLDYEILVRCTCCAAITFCQLTLEMNTPSLPLIQFPAYTVRSAEEWRGRASFEQRLADFEELVQRSLARERKYREK